MRIDRKGGISRRRALITIGQQLSDHGDNPDEVIWLAEACVRDPHMRFRQAVVRSNEAGSDDDFHLGTRGADKSYQSEAIDARRGVRQPRARQLQVGKKKVNRFALQDITRFVGVPGFEHGEALAAKFAGCRHAQQNLILDDKDHVTRTRDITGQRSTIA
jgi:hypothetical protein